MYREEGIRVDQVKIVNREEDILARGDLLMGAADVFYCRIGVALPTDFLRYGRRVCPGDHRNNNLRQRVTL